MQILNVTDTKGADDFLHVPVILYKEDANWIRPLDKDIHDVFDSKKNKAFRFGKVERWILKDEDGNSIGRIAAFVNSKYTNKGDDIKIGGVGFFECINNQDAADLLFDNAKHWLMQQNMEAMDGPINFGERDRWWGLVTMGHHPPLYCMNYNLPFYKDLFETYGFKPFYHQICLATHPKEPFPKKLVARHAEVFANKDFRAEHMRIGQLEKYAEDFSIVYNKAWAGHGGLKQLSKDQVILMFKKMKPVMDEKIIWFAYHKNIPVAIFVNLPDLNQWFKHLKGKFDILSKLKFLFLKTFARNKKFTGLVFGVVPEWHGKGVDSFIIGEAAKWIKSEKSPYTEYEMQWIGDFNPKMINIAEGLGDVHRSRNLTTYRYLFDRTKEFKRHPMLG